MENRWGSMHYLKLCTWIAHKGERDGEDEYYTLNTQMQPGLHLDVTFSSVMQSTSGMQPTEGCCGALFTSLRNTGNFT